MDDVRVKVADDFHDVDAICGSDFLVTYTCDLRPTPAEQDALRSWVTGGGRWFALHATNAAFDPPPDMAALQAGQRFVTPRAFPIFAETLGSQFLFHPAIEPYTVTVSPGAEADPLVADIEPFDANDELYLCEYHGQLIPLLETRWTGSGGGFVESDWPVDEPRLVLYKRPLGQGEVLYFTLGHCRSTWDMTDPPFNGMQYPIIERGSWELGVYYELLRRGLSWSAAPARARLAG
jgi:type 1 glutamine amidotransferase